jgi:hypothetical protein
MLQIVLILQSFQLWKILDMTHWRLHGNHQAGMEAATSRTTWWRNGNFRCPAGFELGAQDSPAWLSLASVQDTNMSSVCMLRTFMVVAIQVMCRLSSRQKTHWRRLLRRDNMKVCESELFMPIRISNMRLLMSLVWLSSGRDWQEDSWQGRWCRQRLWPVWWVM